MNSSGIVPESRRLHFILYVSRNLCSFNILPLLECTTDQEMWFDIRMKRQTIHGEVFVLLEDAGFSIRTEIVIGSTGPVFMHIQSLSVNLCFAWKWWSGQTKCSALCSTCLIRENNGWRTIYWWKSSFKYTWRLIRSDSEDFHLIEGSLLPRDVTAAASVAI